MRDKKDKDTILVVTADDRAEIDKLFRDNPGFEEIKKPELDGILEGLPLPNRTERRRQQFGRR